VRTTTAAGSRGASRAPPGEDHPATVYIREAAIVPKLEEWIAILFVPQNFE
jgi:hypothetical protein